MENTRKVIPYYVLNSSAMHAIIELNNLQQMTITFIYSIVE